MKREGERTLSAAAAAAAVKKSSFGFGWHTTLASRNSYHTQRVSRPLTTYLRRLLAVPYYYCPAAVKEKESARRMDLPGSSFFLSSFASSIESNRIPAADEKKHSLLERRRSPCATFFFA